MVNLTEPSGLRWNKIYPTLDQDCINLHRELATGDAVAVGGKLYMYTGIPFNRFLVNLRLYVLDIVKLRWSPCGDTISVGSSGVYYRLSLIEDKIVCVQSVSAEDELAVSAYDICLDNWVRAPELIDRYRGAPRFRLGYSLNYHMASKSLLVYGGRGYRNFPRETLKYDLDTNTWSTIYAYGTLPKGRAFHGSYLIEATNKLIIVGGFNIHDEERALNDIKVLSLASATGYVWSSLKPSSKVQLGLCVLRPWRGKILLLKPLFPGTDQTDDDEYYYELQGFHFRSFSRDWKELECKKGVEVSSGSSVVSTGERLFVLGGNYARADSFYEAEPLFEK